MATIQLEIPDDLAERLAPYCEQLPELLKIGLAIWQQREATSSTDTLESLLQSLETEGIIKRPRQDDRQHDVSQRKLINSAGTPVSETVIAQRGPL